MALTFFHRFEQQDLDATHDFSAGDTTGAHTNTPTYDPVAAKVGTNGLLIDASERTTFVATSIMSPTVGSAALWFQFPTAFPGSGGAYFFYAAGTDANNDYIRFETLTGGGASNRALRLSTRNSSGASEHVILDDNELTSGAWYFAVIEWDSTTPSRRISIYDTSGTLLDTVSSAAAWTAPVDIVNLHWGDLTGGTGTVYMKNAFIGSAYADGDIFVTNRDITTYTAYDDGSGTESTISNASPQSIALTVNGRAATVNSFSTVTIREVFINEAGSPVQSRTGISLHVWYSGAPNGIADLSLSSLTTDANGTASWSLPTGGLVYNQPIFYVATDGGASLSEYTCARMTPIYS